MARESLSEISEVSTDEARRTKLTSTTADELFKLADKDHSGMLDYTEFKRLHSVWRTTIESDMRTEAAQTAKSKRMKARLSLSLFVTLVMTFFLVLSCVANTISVFYIVDSQVTTKANSSTAGTSQLLTKSGHDITVSQQGDEVPLGLLAYFPALAPTDALKALPEFISIQDPRYDSSTISYKVATVSFSPPLTLTIDTVGGDRIVLDGPARGTLYGSLENGTDFAAEFCSACATVQLRSLVASSHGLQAARSAFDAAMTVLDSNQRALCEGGSQPGQLLSLATQALGLNVDARGVSLPAVCSSTATTTVAAASGRQLAKVNKKAGDTSFVQGHSCNDLWKSFRRASGSSGRASAADLYRQCKRNSKDKGSKSPLFSVLDDDGDQCISLAEFLAFGVFEFWSSDTCGEDVSLDEADEMVSSWSCCSFHVFAEMSEPGDCLSKTEYTLFVNSFIKYRGLFQTLRQTASGREQWNSIKRSGATAIEEPDEAAAEELCGDIVRRRTEEGKVTVVDPITGKRRRLTHSDACPEGDLSSSLYASDGYCNSYDAAAVTSDPDCIEDGCHPADTLLELADGATVRIDQVEVGALVKTAAGFEPVTALMHAEHGKAMQFYRFHTADASMAITANHHLFVDGVEREPSTVRVGELLSTACCGEQPITKIETTVEQGKFHITTPSNSYYADGILASTYVDFVPLNVWKVAGGLYPQLRYQMGLPITPEGAGPFSIFWLLYVYQAIGLPRLVIDALWPLTMTSTLVAELANTAVVQLPVSAAVLTLGAAASLRVARK